MISLVGPITTPAATGGAGAASATFTTSTVVTGEIYGIAIQYNDAPPAATTDIGIKAKGQSGVLPSYNILVIANAATDGYFAVRKPCVDTANAAITDSHACIAVNDLIQVDIAQANNGDSVTVWLYVDK